MRIIAKQLEVNPDDGFKEDVFGRKHFAEAITNLVISNSDGLVISLDAKWGEGKTTFVKKWQGMLKDSGIPSIYIDAFKDDYSSDAFLNLASHITQYAEENVERHKAKEFKENAAKLLVNVLSWGAKVGTKAVTLGLVGATEIDSLPDIKEDIASSTSSFAEKIVKEKLSSARADTALVTSFHSALSSLPPKLANNEGNRLVVIVDELDRCRPTYAVDVLERIKHLFSVQNITFVLVMNKQQLESALKSVYGPNLDARTYLQKFVTVELSLPKKPHTIHGDSDLKIYSRRLYAAHELQVGKTESTVIDYTAVLAQAFDLSLRQLERVYSNITIVYSSINERGYRPALPISFLCVLKVIEPSIFDRLKVGRITYATMVAELQQTYPSLSLTDESSQIAKMFNSVFHAFASDAEFKAIPPNHPANKFGSDLFEYNLERSGISQFLFNKLGLLSVLK